MRTSGGEAVVEMENLSFTFAGAGRSALNRINLKVYPGELLAILGASGSGKSSLCYVITGFIPHFFRGRMEGRVLLGGLDTREYPLGYLVTKAGLVFQNPVHQISGAKPTVYEEVAFGPENLGLASEEIRERVEWALEVLRIGDLKDRSPYALSAGQQQRVAIASVLAMNPQVLVMDTATAYLDPGGVRDIFAIARSLAERGMAVVMAEHHLELVAEFADRAVVLSDGVVVLEGRPQEVLSSPRCWEVGVGPPAYARIAQLCQEAGLGPVSKPLPVTLEEAIRWLQP